MKGVSTEYLKTDGNVVFEILLFNNPEQAENLKRRVAFILRNKNEVAMRSGLSNACSPQRCKTPVGCEVKRLSVHGGCPGSQRR